MPQESCDNSASMLILYSSTKWQWQLTFGSDDLYSPECFYSQKMTILWLVALPEPAYWFLTVRGLVRSSAMSTVGHDDYLLQNDNK